MRNFWFSFSFKGINNGVCVVQAEDYNSALEKTISLFIHPEHDDIACYVLEDSDLDPKISFNRLYFKHEMAELGYNSVNSKS